jgi:hypothetical protein
MWLTVPQCIHPTGVWIQFGCDVMRMQSWNAPSWRTDAFLEAALGSGSSAARALATRLGRHIQCSTSSDTHTPYIMVLPRSYVRAENSHSVLSEGGTVFGRVKSRGAMGYSCTNWSKLASLIAAILHFKDNNLASILLRYNTPCRLE